MTATTAHPYGEPIDHAAWKQAISAFYEQGGNWPFAANVALLRAVLTRISTDPAHWDQSAWSRVLSEIDKASQGATCGTAYCVAGWATHLAGAIDDVASNGHLSGFVEFGGKSYSIETLAKRLLGVDPDEASALFNAGNDAAAVWEAAEQIAACAGLELGVPFPEWASS